MCVYAYWHVCALANVCICVHGMRVSACTCVNVRGCLSLSNREVQFNLGFNHTCVSVRGIKIQPPSTPSAFRVTDVYIYICVQLQLCNWFNNRPDDPDLMVAGDPAVLFATQLAQLAEMGLTDQDQLLPLLVQHGGQVERVMGSLF